MPHTVALSVSSVKSMSLKCECMESRVGMHGVSSVNVWSLMCECMESQRHRMHAARHRQNNVCMHIAKGHANEPDSMEGSQHLQQQQSQQRPRTYMERDNDLDCRGNISQSNCP